MVQNSSICKQFGDILKGKSKTENGVCRVALHRTFKATVQGKASTSVLPVGVLFESLDHNGNALNLTEMAILQEEIPAFMHSLLNQGLIVSALHNHWLYTSPLIMYIHVQSVEPPLDFARKMEYSFRFLSSPPIS
ncbi:DUF1259 domain-containing protein [Sporosarcina thermotolerans]|uniref:DUF1259 domain-containing protein n=1 Tax=Sporosarcina thermotolerans TaxID=633404 RepID=A0AAW9ABU2_9BACL|nr:DUF1259 domain-containing protein [Sporosarcina thermotolerans]MDW0117679.1 DUF1259 domain-containing protein [Sporosarcina thermotolerans]WHT49232.1 DUF1259 domain-containing protein [Sporosarcina thermotolerans]